MVGSAIIWLILAFATTEFLARAPEHGRRVVCYMASWGIYVEGAGRFEISDAEEAAPMCTHIVYMFALLDSEKFVITAMAANRDLNMGGYAQTVGLKKKFPHLKVMICMGGWDDSGTTKYSVMVRDPNKRAKFIKSVEELLISYKFDGLDLNWQYPGDSDRGGSADDKQNLVLLVKELRAVFDKHEFILSVAVSAFSHRIDAGVDGKALAEHAHFLNIISYEYHAWWDNKVGPSTPLNALDNFSVSNSIQRYLKMGAPVSKLNMGLSCYGTTFTLANAEIEGNIIGETTTGNGFRGPFNDENGFIAYNELCREVEAGGWDFIWDNTSQTAFIRNRERVASFDDDKSYSAKIKFAMENQLGGVIYYSLEKDDFHGDCNKSNGPYPLLRSIHNALLKYSAIIYNDLYNLLKQHNSHFFWGGRVPIRKY